MTDQLTPREAAARALADFDRAVHDPNRAADPIGVLFQALGAAADRHAQEAGAARTRWRNRPEAKALRSAAAVKAAETRRNRKAAERAAEEAEAERDARVPTVHCSAMDAVPYGSGETECILPPGHHGEDHEDIDGHRWDNECAGTCEGDCEC
ncbi:hypothetical protein ACKI16_29730 [Streptomyces scabiei]|uniref:hypothetical protein n=1 Tax=Streptomyces scabiei TaxID=1930 RepID=UPI0038F607CB